MRAVSDEGQGSQMGAEDLPEMRYCELCRGWLDVSFPGGSHGGYRHWRHRTLDICVRSLATRLEGN